MRIFLLDNYDSFTYNLADYLSVNGAEVDIMRNDEFEPETLTIEQYDGAVLSPGPSDPQHSGCLPEFIARYVETLPLLGVCLGYQALGQYFGARLLQASEPRHGKQSKIRSITHPMFSGIPAEHLVCRYHSLVLSDIPEQLEITAQTLDGEPMAFAHRQLSIWGVQYHPEAILTEHGHQLIRNWLNLVSSSRP